MLLTSLAKSIIVGLQVCLLLLTVVITSFTKLAGSHVDSGVSRHYHENNIYIQSNVSIHHNQLQSGKWTIQSSADSNLISPKWQWVLKSRHPQHNANVSIRPVRHWWANLQRPHRGQTHTKRSAGQASAKDPSGNTTDAHEDPHHSKLYECLATEWPDLDTPHIMTLEGMSHWVTEVCSAERLDERVKVLLKAIWLCPHHMVCQVLSPSELKNLGGQDKACRHEAMKLWDRFHKIFLVIRDFNDVFKPKFDLPDYSVMFNSTQCQESYNFWTCSFYLPLYLRHPSSAVPVTVKPCQSVCKEVEKTCPFLIKGPDDDKAAGNPSFICKDDLVPHIMSEHRRPSPCCYKPAEDPQQGKWVSLPAVDQFFCQEPDQQQLEGMGHDGTSSLPEFGDGLASSADLYFNAQQKCDVMPSPNVTLNITASEIGSAWYLWRKESEELNHSSEYLEEEEDSFPLIKSFMDWILPNSGVQQVVVTRNESLWEESDDGQTPAASGLQTLKLWRWSGWLLFLLWPVLLFVVSVP